MNWKRYVYHQVANEINRVTRFVARVIYLAPAPHDSGFLLEEIQAPVKETVQHMDDVDLRASTDPAIVLLNGNINRNYDVQNLLTGIHRKLNRSSRVMLVLYNPYLKWMYELAIFFRLRKSDLPLNFLTMTSLHNICRLSGFEIVRFRHSVYLPFFLPYISTFINSFLPAIPLLKKCSCIAVACLRPIVAEKHRPSLSIIIPARNEYGNIESAIQRLPDFQSADLEIVFVEGHSSDMTWDEIQRIQRVYHQHTIIAIQQTGEGKADAVRLGIRSARSDLIVILDADLTMPPEFLLRFYESYCEGHGDFINGNRLVYPMEDQAMQFLNHLGNIFFAKSLSGVLEYPLGDSLCGTKLFSRQDYHRFEAWREQFGDYDPFGDFDLLFPAVVFGLGIVDLPVRYRSRIYGTTNIRRFSHGLQLLKMVFIGLRKIRIA